MMRWAGPPGWRARQRRYRARVILVPFVEGLQPVRVALQDLRAPQLERRREQSVVDGPRLGDDGNAAHLRVARKVLELRAQARGKRLVVELARLRRFLGIQHHEGA